ncbi:MAG: hypothetical protein FWD72_02860 [Eggerthellaceae bacterium]|nr:hypothetical protein [Eggerthellaceae bacterium]
MATGKQTYNYDNLARQMPQEQPQPNVFVFPGGGQQQPRLSPKVLTYVKRFVIALLFVAVVSLVRVTLTNSAAASAQAEEVVTTQIENAKADGSALAAREGYLSNPNTIKEEAAKLFMGPAEGTVAIILPADVVKKDADGDLSLSLSLQAATEGK